jgi:hypothetical protein
MSRMETTWVDLRTASALTGYKPRTLAKLFAQDKIEGERRTVRRGGRRRVCIFVSLASVFAYRHGARTSRQRAITIQPWGAERELVCLECVVPGDCDEDDPRCLYHKNKRPGCCLGKAAKPGL